MPRESEKSNVRGKPGSISPPMKYLIIGGLGVLVGLLLVVGNVSRAMSYLSDEPEVCVNCHVMNPQYATWQRSSHGNNTTCNDCHVPHDNEFNHYFFKAKDGIKHASVFTLRGEPQVIKISEEAVSVVEMNCVRCHEHRLERVGLHKPRQEGELKCWDCHREVPHGTVRSLSATPRVMRPVLPHSGLSDDKVRIGGRAPRKTGDNNEREN